MPLFSCPVHSSLHSSPQQPLSAEYGQKNYIVVQRNPVSDYKVVTSMFKVKITRHSVDQLHLQFKSFKLPQFILHASSRNLLRDDDFA